MARKRGRKPQGEYSNRTATFSARLKPDTRAALVEAAAQSGRVLSQEIEHRLRRSFTEEEKIENVFGSRRNYTLMKIVASVIEEASASRRKLDYIRAYQDGGSEAERQRVEAAINEAPPDWLADPQTFAQVKIALNTLLESLRPPGSPKVMSEAVELMTKLETRSAVRLIQNADPAMPLTEGTVIEHQWAQMKSDLGDLVERFRFRELEKLEADLAEKEKKTTKPRKDKS